MRRTAGVALAVVALVLGGCAEGAEEQPAPTTSTSTSPSASVSTPTSTWPPKPIDYGPVTLVTGSDFWTLVDFGAETTDPDGTTHTRGRFSSRLESADERVTGTLKGTWSTDRWRGALVQWGDSRITTSTGAWVGRMTGIYTAETYDVLAGWFTGTGGNQGLSLYLWETSSGGTEATFNALVFPGEPPPL